jgi:hypothetical protein
MLGEVNSRRILPPENLADLKKLSKTATLLPKSGSHRCHGIRFKTRSALTNFEALIDKLELHEDLQREVACGPM